VAGGSSLLAARRIPVAKDMVMKTNNYLSIGCISLVCVALVFMIGCGMKKETLLSGRTMGTFYHIKVVTGYFTYLDGLQKKIDVRLEEINQSMSTYRSDSEISRFNRMPAGATMQVSADFYRVLQVAAKVFKWSGGAWDGTVKPLVNLWGFGNARPVQQAPAPEAITNALARTGFGHIRMLPDGQIGKDDSQLTLDLASTAKGYGVEAIATLIRREGYRNFLVEIGGEVVAAGVRDDGRPWVVGINRPAPEATATAVYRAFALSDGALATSGDYRNFFELDGVRYSHVIDPRTGYPVANRVASVSVVASNCTLADGLATALMVMGIKEGLSLVNRLENVECLIIAYAPDGQLREHASTGFPGKTS